MNRETLLEEARNYLARVITGEKTMEDLIKFLEDNPIDESE